MPITERELRNHFGGNRIKFASAGAVRKCEGVQPTVSHSKITTIAEDELLDLKRALTLLRAEIHNPGAARYIAQDIDLDRLTDEMVYLIDHALENVRERVDMEREYNPGVAPCDDAEFGMKP